MSADSSAAMGGASISSEPDATLAELGRVISRAAEALATIPSDDDATAYRCSRALDAAFSDLTALLRTVPAVVGLGDPGRAVSERLEQRRAELAARRDEITAYREKLDDLAEAERNHAELTTEVSSLRERVTELERVKRLVSEVPGLRTQVKILEEAVAAAGVADASEVGQRIEQAVGQLAALTGRQREVIGEEADILVAGAEKAAKELAEQRARRDGAAADLAKRESQAAQLAAEHREMLPVLTAWTQADADLAEGLRAADFGAADSVLETVVTELTAIRQRLTDLDNSLRPLLADHAEAYEDARQVRPL
jgi:DNA repair exonuclease SbcCD ATPase subunit